MLAAARRAAAWISAPFALALVLLGTGCSGADPVPVEVEAVRTGEVVATVTAPARVEPAARQDVTSSVSGVVIALAATEGLQVEAGASIVRLESSSVDLARQQAAAAQQAAAEVGGIDIEGGAHGTIDATSDAVADLDARSEPAIAEARASARLVADPAQRAAAEAAVAAVESSYLATRASLLAAGQALADAQAQTAESLSDALNTAIDQATAGQRVQADAAAAAAARQAEGLSVVAPFDGTVSLGSAAATDGGAAPDLASSLGADASSLAGALPGLPGGEGGGTLRVGAPVTAGQTLFTLYDLSSLYAEAEVDEVDVGEVVVGQRATVVVDAVPDAVFDGIVESVAVEAASTQSGGVGYPVRVRLLGASQPGGLGVETDPAPLAALRVGQTSSVEIVTETTDSDLVVPSRALVQRDGGASVYVVRDDVAELVAVEVRTLGQDAAAVSGDLEEGDDVVVSGYEDLPDGAAVDAS